MFVLTDASARTVRRDEGVRQADSKALDAYGRDVLNENGKLLLGFARDSKLALLNTYFLLRSQKWRVLHLPKRQPQQGKGQARSDYTVS